MFFVQSIVTIRTRPLPENSIVRFCSNSDESADSPTITCSWSASLYLPRLNFYLPNGTSKSILGGHENALSEFCLRKDKVLFNNTGSHEFICRIIPHCTGINDVTISCEEEGVSSANVTFLARMFACELHTALIYNYTCM